MGNLRKIKVEELKLGMYFNGFEASSWVDHPFWNNKFLLKEFSDLQLARGSGIADCWIDLERGADLTPEAFATPKERVDAPKVQLSYPADSFFDDVEQARKLCESATAATELMFNNARLGKAIDMEHCLPMIDQITASVMKNSSVLLSVARLKVADDYTYMHSVAVCALMIALARTLGMDDVGCKEAGLAGLLHDIGKAFIPMAILNKAGSLTAAEYEIMRRHPDLGYAHLAMDPSIPRYASEVCLHHHEKIDGSGYPDQLSGRAVTKLSRMAAICDVYDAITSDRTYKKSWDPAESLARMASWHGQFDKTLFSAFVKTLGIYPIGSLLKMESGRTAVVIRQTPTMLTKPVVKIFLQDDSGAIAGTEILDLSSRDVTDGILERGGEEWLSFNNLEKLWVDSDN